MEIIEEKKRDVAFDNIKLLLIFLVVLGHILEEISVIGNLGVIRSVIYSFHMPAFIFISGYFSKNYDKAANSAICKCLIPFFIFNSVWQVFVCKSYNFFMPVYVFWYMLSLFFWRVLIKYAIKIRYILFISVIISLYIGCISQADRFLAIQRTIAFFPFFISGCMCSSEKIKKIRNKNKVATILVLSICIILVAFMYYTNFMPVKAYENIQPYKDTGISNLKGILLRLISSSIAITVIVCIINLASSKEYKATKYGRNTESIYLLSSFVIKISMLLFIKVRVYNFIFCNNIVSVIVSILLSIAIIFICGNKFINDVFNRVLNFISKKLVAN